MVIRDPEVADAERIGLAHSIAAEEAYGHYFPREWMAARNTAAQRTQQWAEQLQTYCRGGSGWRIRIAEDSDQVLGFGIFGRPRDQNAPAPNELHRLYVLSQAYGAGLAHRLFAALHPEQAPSYLWVMEANTRAIAFYRKYGFEPDGVVEYVANMVDLPKIRMVRR